MPSITNVKGSGDGADPADQHNEYVLPTASQLAAWRSVSRSLLAGSWGLAHLQARMISSTYNVVEFLDTPVGPDLLRPHGGRAGRNPRARGPSLGRDDHQSG
jgi:hypothetical protein